MFRSQECKSCIHPIWKHTPYIGYMARKFSLNNLIAAFPERAPVDKFRFQNQTMTLFSIMADDMVCSVNSR